MLTIVAPVAIPVPVSRSPTDIPDVEPAVTVSVVLPPVVEQVTNCLPNKLTPTADITSLVAPPLIGSEDIATVLPKAIKPFAPILKVV